MKKRILVVEDEKEMADLLKGVLEENAYEVLTASNGHEGLGLGISEKPDLIILDVKLPRMDGFEVLRRLRTSEHTRMTPIIMLTGIGQTRAILEAQDLRASDYIIKPINLESFLKTVERCI